MDLRKKARQVIELIRRANPHTCLRPPPFQGFHGVSGHLAVRRAPGGKIPERLLAGDRFVGHDGADAAQEVAFEAVVLRQMSISSSSVADVLIRLLEG